MPDHLPVPSLTTSALRAGVPFLRCGLDDDEAVAFLDEVAESACALDVHAQAHLVDDLGGSDLWTIVVHLVGSRCPVAEGIHQFRHVGGDDGASS